MRAGMGKRSRKNGLRQYNGRSLAMALFCPHSARAIALPRVRAFCPYQSRFNTGKKTERQVYRIGHFSKKAILPQLACDSCAQFCLSGSPLP